MDGQHDLSKSELKFLERLSIEELEALLRFSGDPADVEMLFDMIVEEVVAREEKNPTGRLPDVDASWEELQVMYQNLQDRETPTSEGAVLGRVPKLLAAPAKDKPKRISLMKVIRTAAIMTAAVVLSLALMVGAQAAGADVFGALARWTDETFHFETRPADVDSNGTLYESIQTALNVQESLGRYAPKWYPEGTSIIDVQVFEDDLGISAQVSLSDGNGNHFFIGVDQYKQEIYIDPQTFEIEANTIEEYVSNGKTYFIFENSEKITTVWSDGTTMQSIWGRLDTKSVKLMIDSIGGK